MKYEIYTDGSTRVNGTENAVGAWAYAVLSEEGKLILSANEAEKGTTNQRMELTAAIEALRAVLSETAKIPKDLIIVYTDSAYLHNCYSQKWYINWRRNGWVNSKKQPVANQDLWEQLIPYFDMFGVEFRKVRGHADNTWNNYVDKLAQSASAELMNKGDN